VGSWWRRLNPPAALAMGACRRLYAWQPPQHLIEHGGTTAGAEPTEGHRWDIRVLGVDHEGMVVQGLRLDGATIAFHDEVGVAGRDFPTPIWPGVHAREASQVAGRARWGASRSAGIPTPNQASSRIGNSDRYRARPVLPLVSSTTAPRCWGSSRRIARLPLIRPSIPTPDRPASRTVPIPGTRHPAMRGSGPVHRQPARRPGRDPGGGSGRTAAGHPGSTAACCLPGRGIAGSRAGPGRGRRGGLVTHGARFGDRAVGEGRLVHRQWRQQLCPHRLFPGAPGQRLDRAPQQAPAGIGVGPKGRCRRRCCRGDGCRKAGPHIVGVALEAFELDRRSQRELRAVGEQVAQGGPRCPADAA
jgi:hypothetical protein